MKTTQFVSTYLGHISRQCGTLGLNPPPCTQQQWKCWRLQRRQLKCGKLD